MWPPGGKALCTGRRDRPWRTCKLTHCFHFFPKVFLESYYFRKVLARSTWCDAGTSPGRGRGEHRLLDRVERNAIRK